MAALGSGGQPRGTDDPGFSPLKRFYLRSFYNWWYLSNWRAEVRVPDKYRPWLEERLRAASPTRIGRWRHGPAGVAWCFLGTMVVFDAGAVTGVLFGSAVVAFGVARLVICWRFAVRSGDGVLEKVASRNDLEYVTAGHIRAVARAQAERLPAHEARVQMIEDQRSYSWSAYGGPPCDALRPDDGAPGSKVRTPGSRGGRRHWHRRR